MLLRVMIVLVLVSGCTQAPKYPVVKAEGDAVRIPLKDVNDGHVHFFTFRSGGKNVNFLVRMDGVGKLHACFDACYSCYKFKKGYRQEGTDVVCNECGTRFRLADEVWKHEGGCAPIGLTSTMSNDSIVISVADLKKGERLF